MMHSTLGLKKIYLQLYWFAELVANQGGKWTKIDGGGVGAGRRLHNNNEHD